MVTASAPLLPRPNRNTRQKYRYDAGTSLTEARLISYDMFPTYFFTYRGVWERRPVPTSELFTSACMHSHMLTHAAYWGIWFLMVMLVPESGNSLTASCNKAAFCGSTL